MEGDNAAVAKYINLVRKRAYGSLLGDAPILNKSTEAHKLLWPIEKTMLDKDPALEQTPGYK